MKSNWKSYSRYSTIAVFSQILYDRTIKPHLKYNIILPQSKTEVFVRIFFKKKKNPQFFIQTQVDI